MVHNGVPRSYTADPRIHVDHGKTTMSDKGEEDHITSIKQSGKASGRHVACNDQLDCIIVYNMPANMTMKSGPSPIRSQIRPRSGQISDIQLRLETDT